jgi:membrane protein implicated in regulation of membrane protease activity
MDWARDSLGLLWVGLAITAGVIEVFTLDLIFLMVAGGALVAALAAALTGNVSLSILVFAGATVLLLFGARPQLHRYMKGSVPAVTMHTEALVGRTAQAVTTVDTDSGQIKLAGELWSARMEAGHEPAASGSTVHVVRIDGATAVVTQQPSTPAR